MPDEVRVGQVWASKDRRDVEQGLRQRRIVTMVDSRYAYLRTEGGRSGSTRVLLTADRKGIRTYQLVDDA